MAPLRREQAGLFVADHRNFTAHAQWAWAAGFPWVMFHAHAGAKAPEPYGHVPQAKIDACKKLGFDVGGWGSFGSTDDPIACAQAAHGVITAKGFGFYCANIEVPYPDRAFVDEFRRLRPKFTLWLSSEISNPRNWDAWFGAPGQNPTSTCWQPQCYTNANPAATPVQAHFWAVRKDGHGYGIPASYVKPTIGVYDPRKPLAQYAAQLKAGRDAGLGPGFSVWLGETVTQPEYVQLGTMIANGAAA